MNKVKTLILFIMFILCGIYTIKTDSLAGAFWCGALAMVLTIRCESELHNRTRSKSEAAVKTNKKEVTEERGESTSFENDVLYVLNGVPVSVNHVKSLELENADLNSLVDELAYGLNTARRDLSFYRYSFSKFAKQYKKDQDLIRELVETAHETMKCLNGLGFSDSEWERWDKLLDSIPEFARQRTKDQALEIEALEK
jgi:hypothetical protein